MPKRSLNLHEDIIESEENDNEDIDFTLKDYLENPKSLFRKSLKLSGKRGSHKKRPKIKNNVYPNSNQLKAELPNSDCP